MLMPLNDPFVKVYDAGYRRIVPILPHDAVVSQTSSLIQRMRESKDDPRGKAPGRRLADGTWTGLGNWQELQPTRDDIAEWASWGAGVGLIAGLQHDGNYLVLLDNDSMDENLSRRFLELYVEHFHVQPFLRVGRSPKAMVPIRCVGPFPFTKLTFKGGHVETPKQAVAFNIHPVTKRPYDWPVGFPDYSELPLAEVADLQRFFDRIRREFPEAELKAADGPAKTPEQSSLAGDPDVVRKAIAALPNTTAAFPTRDSYLEVAYALKASLPNDQALAEELFLQWCGRWQDPARRHNDPTTALLDFKRAKPPFRIGVSWLCDKAAEHGGQEGVSAAVSRFFQPIPPELWATEGGSGSGALGQSNQVAVFETLSLDDIKAMPRPRDLIKRYIREGGLFLIYGRQGSFKSFLTLDMALHIAHNRPEWRGNKINTRPGAGVLYVAAEGAGGLQPRIRAWERKNPLHGLPEGTRPRFRLIRQTVDMMKLDEVRKLIRTIQALVDILPLDILFLDTLSRAIPGADENLQKDMSLLIEHCGLVQQALGCAVALVHHTNAQGNLRGGTPIPAGADDVFKVTRRGDKLVIDVHADKRKDSEDRWTDTFALDVVELGEDEEGAKVSSLVPRLLARGEPGAAGDSIDDDVVDAVAKAAAAGRHWAKGRNSDRNAVRKVVTGFGLVKEAAEALLSRLEDEGRIAFVVLDAKSKARGYVVAEAGEQTSCLAREACSTSGSREK